MTRDEQMNAYKSYEGFTGKTLTYSQCDEAASIASLIKRNIKKTGKFVEKLNDYSHAFARTEKFDQMRGEDIIRNIFKDINGQTMNQMREDLMARDKNLPKNAEAVALENARNIEPLIRKGKTMPFYKAFDVSAVTVSDELGITESKAKELMKETYQVHEGRDLYQVGKEVEKTYHEPAREAAREKYLQEKAQKQSVSKTKSYSKARARA